MSLEPSLAALVAASTQLTKSIAVPLSQVNGKRDAATTAEADITAAETAISAAATTSTTSASTTASKLTTAASDYAAQKTSKGLAAVQTSADSELKDRLHRRDPARHPFRGARPSLVMDFVRRECHRNNAAGNLEPVDLNSFMTFTRASTATVVGPDGLIKEVASNVPRYGYDPVTGEALGLLIEEQRTNLLPGSLERLHTWYLYGTDPIRSSILSPDGKLNAFKLTERAVSGAVEYYMRSNVSNNGTAGQSFCASVYVHTSSERTPRLRVTHVFCATPTTEVSFNISTRSFDTPSGYVTSTGYSDAGNGWLRIWLVYTLPTASVTEWGLNLQGGTTTGDGVSGVLIYGPQLEIGSFPTSYIPTPATFTGRASTKTYFDSNGVLQTAASGVAATDYGYVDGRWVSKGLSLEPQATNLLTNSYFASGLSGWSGGNGCVTSASTTRSVFGAQSLKCLGDTSTAWGQVTGPTVAVSPNTQYTFSVWVYGVTANKMTLDVYDQGNGIWLATDECSTTTLGRWVRLSVTRTTGATTTSVKLYFRPNLGTTAASETYWDCAQIETGPVATSYIPTTTAQVTRAADTSTSAQVTRGADDAVSTQAAALYNLDGGTTCVSTQQYVRGSWPGLYHWDGDYSIFATQGMNYLGGRGSGGAVGFASAAIGGSLKHALRQNRTTVSASQNAAGPISASLPRANSATVSRLVVGKGTSDRYNGHIKQLTYFPRQLSDADLQALTILED